MIEGKAATPIALVAVVLGLAHCSRDQTHDPVQWRVAVPGFEVAKITTLTPLDDQPIAVHLLRVDLKQHRLRVVDAAQGGKKLADAAEFMQLSAGLAAINGGYFDPEYKPLGLLISDGKELSKLRKVDHGVFYVAAGKPGLQHARQWQPPQALEFAVECGPRLVVQGQPLHFKPGRARRVAIGNDPQNRVILAVSAGALTLEEWAALLGRSESTGGAGLSDALNLDGGSSTMLEVHAGASAISLRTAVQVPIGIAVVARPRKISAPAAD